VLDWPPPTGNTCAMPPWFIANPIGGRPLSDRTLGDHRAVVLSD